MKRALITGITGQDGSYLAELLLEKGYTVHGMARRSSHPNLSRITHLLDNKRLHLHAGDMADYYSLKGIVEQVQPDEVYNLAAMSQVKASFEIPEYTCNIDAIGPLRLLEAIREHSPHARFYQASTSELYGNTALSPQTETTPFSPRSPYGIAKLYAYWTTVNFREAYNLYTCNGILFNHESPRRSPEFVTRKISTAVANIARGNRQPLILGNLNAKRDWGYAKEFVEGIWMMMQHSTPEDFVLATGRTFSVREFVEIAFREIDIEIAWEGIGAGEKGRDTKTGDILVEISPTLFRPAEVNTLIGDATKAKRKLGWEHQTRFEDLVRLMVQADLAESVCV